MNQQNAFRIVAVLSLSLIAKLSIAAPPAISDPNGQSMGLTPGVYPTTVTAANVNDALAQIQGQCYDVILSDLHMPDLDGPAFYALLGQQYPALCPRVIFLTGAASEATTQAFLAQCGQPWLRKPFAFAVLRRVLAQMLGDGLPASIAPGP